MALLHAPTQQRFAEEHEPPGATDPPPVQAGALVGALEGDDVGALEGVAVGLLVGALEGEEVGLRVGAFEGLLVGGLGSS